MAMNALRNTPVITGWKTAGRDDDAGAASP